MGRIQHVVLHYLFRQSFKFQKPLIMELIFPLSLCMRMGNVTSCLDLDFFLTFTLYLYMTQIIFDKYV